LESVSQLIALLSIKKKKKKTMIATMEQRSYTSHASISGKDRSVIFVYGVINYPHSRD